MADESENFCDGWRNVAMCRALFFGYSAERGVTSADSLGSVCQIWRACSSAFAAKTEPLSALLASSSSLCRHP